MPSSSVAFAQILQVGLQSNTTPITGDISENNELSSKRMLAKLPEFKLPERKVFNSVMAPANLVESLPERMYNKDLYVRNDA